MIVDRLIRLRSRAHLDRLRTLPCSILGCHGWPVDPHHLKCGPEGGGTVRASDNFAVPLCRWRHHSATSRDGVHATGNERAWWEARNIDPVALAASLWAESEGP